MSGYPDSNYAPPPNYDVVSGTDCSNAKPFRFWNGAYFCADVTVDTNLKVIGNLTATTGQIAGAEFLELSTTISVPLTVTADTVVKAYLTTDSFQVKEIEFRAVRLPLFDNYYVLASYIPPQNGNS